MQRIVHISLIGLFLNQFALGEKASAQVVLISEPKEGDVSSFRNQAIIGQALAGMPIRLEINGVAVDSCRAMPNGAFEFLGVATPEGPIRYMVTGRLANGTKISAERHIHVRGSPASIVVSMPSSDIPADGQTVIPVTAHIVDKWGVRIPDGYFVTVVADSLAIQGEDADPARTGFQVRLIGGDVSFGLKARTHPGPALLTMSTNGIRTRIPLHVRTPRVPLMIVASADATGKYQIPKGSIEGLSSQDDFAQGLRGNGRIACIAHGTIFEDYLLTLSVDSDRKLQNQIFRDIDPKSLYSMYGDNSIVTYEAQSTSPVFAKLERDRSYVMFGDYTTLVTRNEFSGYNRSFTGGKIHFEGGHSSFDLFGTVTNRRVVQDEIRGQGISGYYYLQENNIVTGSEKVRIEVRDRFHSEVVVTRREKARYSDYEIDYIQGSLYFKQPIQSLDEHNNPVYIVISYEAITNNASNVVAGGAGELKLFNRITFGATSVVEQRSPQNYLLLGGNICWQEEKLGTLQGEAARSHDISGKGSAWKIEADISPHKLFDLRPYYRKVDASFANPTQAGGGRELGTTKYGSSFEFEPIEGTKVGGEYYEQHQSLGTSSTNVRSASGFVQQSFGQRGGVDVKVEDVQYNGENPNETSQDLTTHSTLLTGTSRATIVGGLRATAGYEKNLRKAETQVRPNSVDIGLEYQISSAIVLSAQQKFLDDDGRLTTVGVATKFDDQTSAYGRYEVGGSASGERNAATIGLKNSLKLTEALTTNVLYEKVKNLSRNLVEARTPDHDALSLAIEYLPPFPFKATAKGEYNKDNTNTRRSMDAGLVYKFLDNLSILGKGTCFINDGSLLSGSVKQSDAILGLAYRPARTNWLNVIGKVELKTDRNSSVIPGTAYSAAIISMHMYLEPFRGMELGIKYALKNGTDEFDGIAISSVSDFILVRPQFDLTRFWNIAGEFRALRQRTVNDLKLGYSVETGFVAMKNTMIAVGYNFQTYRERDLVDNSCSVAGPYVTLRLKFTEEFFGVKGME